MVARIDVIGQNGNDGLHYDDIVVRLQDFADEWYISELDRDLLLEAIDYIESIRNKAWTT